MRVALTNWQPDLPDVINQKGVTVAKNVVPILGGYENMPSLATVTGVTALAKRCRGSIVFTDNQGVPWMFAGDETALYTVSDTGATDVSRTPGYAAFSEVNWEFALFGNTVVAVNPNDESQYFDLGTASASSTFDDLAQGSAPRARHVGVVENFLVMGNVFEPVEGANPNAISWSARDNPFSWPARGTAAAVAAQSDRQVLEGDGGWVQSVIPGSEVGIVFQERAIWRMDYVGSDVVFQLTRAEPNRGLLVPGLAVPFGRNVFYLAEDGFYVFDYTTSIPVGKSKVNDFFLDDLDADYYDRVSVRRDPDNTRIWIGYPGAGNSSGTPNKLLVYDWALNEFSQGELTHECLAHAIAEGGKDLDSAADPPDDPDDLGDSDPTVGDTTFDARVAASGVQTLGAFDTTHLLQQFTGTGLEGTIETGDLELQPGARSFLSEIRPAVDTSDVTIQVATKGDRRDEVSYGRIVALDRDGKCSVRADGRYHRIRVNLPANSGRSSFLDLTARASGRH